MLMNTLAVARLNACGGPIVNTCRQETAAAHPAAIYQVKSDDDSNRIQHFGARHYPCLAAQMRSDL